MKVKSILIATLTIFIFVNGSFAKDKKRINELKIQLRDKLNCSFVKGDYREGVFVSLKGTGTSQFIIFKSINDYEDNLDKTYKYKVNFSDVEKVEYFNIRDNSKNACGIKIHLKKRCTYTVIQHKPQFAKVKRSSYSIVIQSSGKRTDILNATNILSELVAEYE